MRLLILRCGNSVPLPNVPTLDFSAVPSRAELRALDAVTAELLPVDDSPSLDEISRRPFVAHLGAPVPSPQRPIDDLRVVVVGSDAAVGAVVTRLMRSDDLWVQVAFVPTEDSSRVARVWGVDGSFSQALTASARPTCLIRDDAAQAIVGGASISQWAGRDLTGEIVVDDEVIFRHEARRSWRGGVRRSGFVGASVTPLVGAPGLAAAAVVPGAVADAAVARGRAVQAGGVEIRVSVDGVSRKRPVDKVTMYRHLRDMQVVRP